MANRGKFLIGAILSVALFAAGFAWWHQFRQGQRVMALWGPAAAYRIRMAPECQLLTPTLGSPMATPPAGDQQWADEQWAQQRAVEIGNRPGFVHARQALIHDASYDWAATARLAHNPTLPSDVRWQYMFRFVDRGDVTRIVFDLERDLVWDFDQGVIANAPGISRGLQTFIDEALTAASMNSP